MSHKSNKTKNFLSSEPVVVSASTSDIFKKSDKMNNPNRLNKSNLQKGGAYKIKIKQNDATKLKSQLKTLRESISPSSTNKLPKKEHIKIKNLSGYKEVINYINKALGALGTDASSEKDKLIGLKTKFEAMSNSDTLYKFNDSIMCEVSISSSKDDQPKTKGEIVGIDADNLTSIIIKINTSSGNFDIGDHIVVSLENSIIIDESIGMSTEGNSLGSTGGGNKKSTSIFSPSISTSTASTASTASTTSIKTSSVNSSSTKTSSFNSSPVNSSSSSVRTSSVRTSSAKTSSNRSDKLESPPTESSLSASSISSNAESPYLATSEYDTIKSSESIDEDTETAVTEDTEDTEDTQDTEDTEDTEGTENSDDDDKDNEKSDDAETGKKYGYSTVDALMRAVKKIKTNKSKRDSAQVNTISTRSIGSSSNKSEYAKNKHMRGGSSSKQNNSKSNNSKSNNSKSNDSKSDKAKHSNTEKKFMKAGRSDKIGIIETNISSSNPQKNYYSESTSIEEGLCE
jgi:hypothetical protein